MTADQQKKLTEKLDKCKQDSQKVRASAAESFYSHAKANQQSIVNLSLNATPLLLLKAHFTASDR